MAAAISDTESSAQVEYGGGHEVKRQDMLARSLTRQQIQMIALGGTIGSGLFLGLGKALSTGGPGSTLIAYSIVGLVVYLTMLCLGEMSAYMPIAGSFTTYATRFVDEGFGFALTWNYWFNDAVSVAGDLTAFMMLLEFWGHFPSWIVALCVLGLLVLFNYFGVKIYGVVEYWLSILKVVTIILYIIVSISMYLCLYVSVCMSTYVCHCLYVSVCMYVSV